MSIPRRGLNLVVAEELADHGQALAERQRMRSIGVPEVVNAHVLKLRAISDAPPRPLQVGARRRGRVSPPLQAPRGGEGRRAARRWRESQDANGEPGGCGRALVAWEPNRIAARAGGVEVYRGEEIELRAGDRIRWRLNDAGLGLVNSGTAEVAAVGDGRVKFRLEDGRMLDLAHGDPQLRNVDRA